MIPFLKRVKNPGQKMVPFQSEKVQNSSTKNEPFQKRVKIPQQKWYNFRRGSNIVNKNGTILEKGRKSSTKMVPFQAEEGKNSSTKCNISEKDQKYSTKIVPF